MVIRREEAWLGIEVQEGEIVLHLHTRKEPFHNPDRFWWRGALENENDTR